MAVIRLIFLGLVVFSLSRCRDSSESFSSYSADPLPETFLRNDIAAYVQFIIVSDTLAKGDSISFDEKGNVVSRINVGGSKSQRFYTYDTLNRLIHEIQRSDIYNEICTRYEEHPKEREIIRYTYFCELPDSTMLPNGTVWKEVIKYDDRLEKIIQRMEIDPNHDTTLVLYTYEGDQLILESMERNGHKAFQKEYFYLDDRLININTTLTGLVDDDDYLSNDTGLIDSTITRREGDTVVIYYKYYHKTPHGD